MDNIRWTPGPWQLLVPVAVHTIGCSAVVIVSGWCPPVAWALVALAASFAFELWRVVRMWRKPIELKVLDRRLWLSDGAIWQRLEHDEAWLGPYLVVLRRARRKKDDWWIYRAELSSPHDALLRRTLRSTGDGLKHVERVEHRAP